jgi:hypothetical protein
MAEHGDYCVRTPTDTFDALTGEEAGRMRDDFLASGVPAQASPVAAGVNCLCSYRKMCPAHGRRPEPRPA